MRNKYLRRGLWLLLFGITFNVVGWEIKTHEWGLYGWAMIIGTVLFGIGFIYIFYSFVRRIERQGIQEERAENAKKLAEQETI